MEKTVKIGLLGCGTVGGGVIIVLNENKEEIAKKAGCNIELIIFEIEGLLPPVSRLCRKEKTHLA